MSVERREPFVPLLWNRRRWVRCAIIAVVVAWYCWDDLLFAVLFHVPPERFIGSGWFAGLFGIWFASDVLPIMGRGSWDLWRAGYHGAALGNALCKGAGLMLMALCPVFSPRSGPAPMTLRMVNSVALTACLLSAFWREVPSVPPWGPVVACTPDVTDGRA